MKLHFDLTYQISVYCLVTSDAVAGGKVPPFGGFTFVNSFVFHLHSLKSEMRVLVAHNSPFF